MKRLQNGKRWVIMSVELIVSRVVFGDYTKETIVYYTRLICLSQRKYINIYSN